MSVSLWLEGRKPRQVVRAVRQEIGYSVEALASATEMGAPTIRDTEWGLYNEIPPKLLNYLSLNFDFDPSLLNEQLRIYRNETRTLFGEEYGDYLPSEFNRYNFFEKVYKNLGVGQHSFAKCICVQRAELYRLETRNSTTLPQNVFDALATAINPAYALKAKAAFG